MSINLLEVAKGYLTKEVVSKASSFLGESEDSTQSGINHILPAILGTVVSKSSDKSQAEGLFNMVSKPEFGGGLLDNIGDLFSGSDSANKSMDLGGSLIEGLFGDKFGPVLDLISSKSGMKSGSSSGLMKLLMPMVMSMIGKKVKSEGLGLDGLMGLLAGQKSHLEAGAPKGFLDNMMSSLGLGSLGAGVASVASGIAGGAGDAVDSAKEVAGNVADSAKETAAAAGAAASSAAEKVGDAGSKAATAVTDTVKKGPSLLSRILPLLLILGALAIAALLWKNCSAKDAVEGAGSKIEEGVKGAAGAVGDAAKGAAGSLGDLAGNAAGIAERAGMSAVDAAKDLAERGIEVVGEGAGDIYNAGEDLVGKAVAGFENLGAFFKKKLKDGTEIIIPEYGVENQLITFIEGKDAISKEAWFNFDRILFDTGSANISAQSMGQIKNMAAILNAYPDVNLKIGGYTDNTGNPDGNLSLSQRRADAVMAAVVAEGIDAGRLEAEGYGEQHPVASNDTAEGRAKNRRIAVNVTKK